MASVSGHKRKHVNKTPAELANNNLNLKASVSDKGVVTFAPLQNKPKWNIKLCLENAAVSGVHYQTPNKIEVEHEGSIRELVENIEDGIEHSFAIAEGPAGPFSLRLGVTTDGISKIAEHNSNFCFWGNDGPVFVYQNLVVRDATGHQVKSTMNWETEGPSIILNVLEAPVFPILIDPLATIPGKALLPFKLPENLLSFLGPGAKVVDVTCSSTIANFAEDSSSSEEEEVQRRKKKSSKEGSSSTHHKIGLPTFAKLFPTFKLPTQWLRSLYGSSKIVATLLPKGHSALMSHSSLPHLDIGLDRDGTVRFDGKTWFLNVSLAGLDLSTAELFHGPNLQVLRGETSELGISFYKDSARHFFMLSKPLQGKFVLRFALNGVASVEFDSANGYIVVLEAGQPRLVYAAPLLRLPSGQTIALKPHWEGTSLSLDLPSTADSFPLVVAFSVVGKKPEGPKSLATLFPLKFTAKGEVHDSASSSASSESEDESSSSSEDELSRKKSKHVSISSKVPSLKSWTAFLYGKGAGLAAVPHGQAASLQHESLNGAQVDLSLNGEIEYTANDWKIKFTPNFPISSPQLLRGKNIQLVRGEDSETGLSFDPKHTRHFFIYSKAPTSPKLLLQLEQIEGATALEYDPERGHVAFRNQEGHLYLSYSSPIVILPSGETEVAPVTWDPENSGIAIELPQVSPLVIVFGVVAEIQEDPLSFVASRVKRGTSGRLEVGFVEDEDEEEEDEPEKPKKSKRSVGKLNISLSAFEDKFPNFKLGKSWTAILYGKGEANLAPVAAGHAAIEAHPSLNNIEVTLAENGEVDFGNSSWKVKLSPQGFSFGAPKLYKREGLQLLRGDDVETGLSFDKNTTRHFFLIAKSPSSNKLQLKLEQLIGSTKLEYNPDLGYVAFLDQNDKLIVVYSSPLVRLASNETITVPIEWDAAASAISINLPEGNPISVAFGLAAVLPKSKKEFLALLFPWIRFGANGNVEGEEGKLKAVQKGEKTQKTPAYNFPTKSSSPPKSASPVPTGDKTKSQSGLKVGIPQFAKSPIFDLGRTWISNLYGTAEDPLSPVTGEFARHAHPSLNKLDVGLSLTGEAEFNSPDWKVKFAPNFEIANPKLWTGNGVHLLRGDDGETGLSFDKHSSRHFFFFGKQPPERFLLSLEAIEGTIRVEVNKEKALVALFDGNGKLPRLVYSAPTAKLANNQTITLGLDWDAAASAIAITLPEPCPPPFVLALALGLKYTELKGKSGTGTTTRSATSTPEPEVKQKLKSSVEISEPAGADAGSGKVAAHGRTGSFSGVKYHNFKLSHSWMADLYGGSDFLTRLPGGKLPKQTHPALGNIDVTLLNDGSVEFGTGDWRGKLTPSYVPTPPVPHRGDAVQLLRGEDGETGIYSDKITSRHFFLIGKAPTSKFSIKFSQVSGNTKIEYSKEKGFVAFSDPTGKYKLVYSLPRVQTGSGKSTKPPIEWDNASGSISVNLPDLVVPIIIAFHLGVKLPTLRASYDVDESKEKEGVKSGLPTFSLKFPNFKLSRPWHDALYGPNELVLTPVSGITRQAMPALNGLEVGLSPAGDVEFGAADWKVKLAPVKFTLSSPKLHKGDGIQVVRANDGEVGLAFDDTSLRQYFYFGKAPQAQKFSIKLTPLSGSVKVELNKEKGVIAFTDHNGKTKFVYTSPVILLGSNKTVPVNIDWEGPSSSIFVLLPDMTYPMVLAFGIGSKIPESREKSRNSSFPSFKFGPSGNIEIPANEEPTESSKEPKRTTTTSTAVASDKAKQFGFSFKVPKPSLPSFSVNFPKTFKIGTSWSTTLYGRSGHTLSPVPEGQALKIAYPALPHFEVGLSPAGEVLFGAPDWKLSVAPVGFKIIAPKLLKADGLQVLRGDDGEVGVSFDDTSSRHYFILGKAPASTKFSLKFTQSGANIDYNKEKGYLALLKGPVPLVYYAPMVLLPTGKTVPLPLEWDASSSTLFVVLPDLAFPVIIAFGLGTKIPDGKHKFGFPSFKFKSSGEPESDDSSSSSSSDDEDDKGTKRSKPSTSKISFPVSYQKGVPSPQIAYTLYGVSDVPLAEVPSGQSAVLKHPSLGLDLGLHPNGELEFSSPSFKVKLAPSFVLTSPKLFKREGLQVLRADDGEIGVSYSGEGPSRHFFIFSKAPKDGKLSLSLVALTGGVKLKFDKNFSLEIGDQDDKHQFVYHSPVAQFGTKTVTLPLQWDAATSAFFVQLPDSASYPLLVAFGVNSKVLEGTARWGVIFPSLRGRVSRTGEVEDKPEESAKQRKKLVLPSFFSSFSPAKLVKWIATLYGPNIKADKLVEPPAGETFLRSTLPSLDLTVSLNEDGEAEFASPQWKGKFFPNAGVRFSRLLSHEGLQLLRHSDGEMGISFDKSSIRYFFVLNSPVEAFVLNFEQIEGSTKLEFFEDRGILSFSDEEGKIVMVISSPLLLSGEKTSPVLLTWDGAINVAIPPNTKFPVVLTFGITAVAPEPEAGISAFFPDLQISAEGTFDDEEESEDADTMYTQEEAVQIQAEPEETSEERQDPDDVFGKFGFASRHPSFKLDSHWIKALYGPDRSSPMSTLPQGQASIFFHPSLGNLKVGINYFGEITFQDIDWKLVVSTSCPITKDATLIERDDLQLLRNEHGEVGLSFDKKGSRFFIILGSSPTPVLTLVFKIDAGTKVVHSKERGFVVFQDKSGKPKLVFASPVARIANNQNYTFPIEYNATSHAITIPLPVQDPVPTAFAFALYPTPPPEEKKGSGKWGLGAIGAAISSSVSSALGYFPEGWEPAVPGIDAPLYVEQHKSGSPNLSQRKPASLSFDPSGPPEGYSTFKVEAGADFDEPVMVSERVVPVESEVIDVEDDTPRLRSAAPSISAPTELSVSGSVSLEAGVKDNGQAVKDVAKDHEKGAKAAEPAKRAKDDKASKDAKEKAATDAKSKAVDDKEREKEREKAAKEAQKDKELADKAAKEAEKEKEKAAKEAKEKADKAAKEAEKDKEKAAKEAKDKAAADDKEREKEREKAAKEAEKEKERADKAAKEAEKDKEKAAKEAKEKADKAAKEAEKEKDKAAKDAKDKAAKDDKEREKEREKAAKEAGKEHEKATKGADKPKEITDREHLDAARKVEREKAAAQAGQEKAAKDKQTKASEKDKIAAKERKERNAKEIAKLGPLPSAEFDRGFRGALYGKVDLDNFIHEAPSTTLYSATTNLTFEITGHDGVLTIGPSQGNAWHVRVVPVGLTWHSETAKLFKGSAFVSVRSEGIEIGAQVREDSSSQFFVLGKGGPLVLQFETSGIGEIKHTEHDGETLFSDVKGNPLFIYSTPALHARSRFRSKEIKSKISWNSQAKELRIESIDYSEALGIVCAICTKCITLPPDDVMYAMPDGSFVVVHPKVNFYGQASAKGISYKSLTPEVDPWAITFSLQGARVHKIYAQSKCTIVLLRGDGIREYLAYVDRGEYVGLNQSFHLYNPPASYPMRIPISLSLENITEVEQSADSVITFSTQSGPVFAYGNVVVLDARGNSVASNIQLENDEKGTRIILEVLEEGEFPLVVG